MGSYVGQDSFGDKCLLRCVVTQLQTVFGQDVRLVSDIQENHKQAQQVAPEVEFTLNISQLFSDWFNRLRHLHSPFSIQIIAAVLTFPLWLAANSENRSALKGLVRETKACSCLYFYGGTQLSEPWFAENLPPLFFMLTLCRLFRKPVYWGPQQYGPEKSWQRRWLRFIINHFVTDIRTRNVKCVHLLALPKSSLFYDEVFSCRARYPLCVERIGQPTFILINMRASNFVRDATDAEFQAFGEILRALHQQLNLPFKLFQMSGTTFCDDQQLKSFLDRNEFGKVPIEILSALDQERDFIETARKAYGTVSMSFHGCILSMIGGCPAVPVTSERYYDYKYADFERYTGDQDVPIISLQDLNSEQAAERIVHYFEQYQPVHTAAAREQAAAQISQWYGKICDNSRNDAREKNMEYIEAII
jgi:polysaccharide pyruvyl transferase WcaK-like protein